MKTYFRPLVVLRLGLVAFVVSSTSERLEQTLSPQSAYAATEPVQPPSIKAYLIDTVTPTGRFVDGNAVVECRSM